MLFCTSEREPYAFSMIVKRERCSLKVRAIGTFLPSHNGKEANDIEEKDHQRVDAQVEELAFAAEDQAINIDSGQQDTEAGKIDIRVFCLRQDRLP